MPRNLSVNDYFVKHGEKHVPKFRFNGKTNADWQKWHDELLPAVIRTLGPLPNKVPLNPELIAEWHEGGLIKQRVIFDVEENMSATAFIYRPANATGKLPAILCCHGHNSNAKDNVMGNRPDPAASAIIDNANYSYGLQLAKAGFVTIAIDSRGFGDRDDRRQPRYQNICGTRDQCNVHYLRATLLGETILGHDVHDWKCAADYLGTLDFVNPDRLGVMGLSFGGTMTTWISFCDPRIKAANIICYSDRFADFGMKEVALCGSQITPGLFALCDVPDLQGLSAPKPLLVEIGVHDDCFLVGPATSCFKEVEKIYTAAGAREKLVLDLFQGGHRWNGKKSVAFFQQSLA